MTDQTQPSPSTPEAHPGEASGPAPEARGAVASATVASATVAQVAQVAPSDGPSAHGAPAHGAAAHGAGGPAAHGGHDHADESEPLGPVDLRAWGAGLLGALAALAVAVAFAISTGRIVV